jgi:hypothetical protein
MCASRFPVRTADPCGDQEEQSTCRALPAGEEEAPSANAGSRFLLAHACYDRASFFFVQRAGRQERDCAYLSLQPVRALLEHIACEKRRAGHNPGSAGSGRRRRYQTLFAPSPACRRIIQDPQTVQPCDLLKTTAASFRLLQSFWYARTFHFMGIGQESSVSRILLSLTALVDQLAESRLERPDKSQVRQSCVNG